MNETSERTAPVLVSVKVIAEVLGVSETAVYRYVSEGRLPHIKVGGTIRFDPEVVAETLCAGAT